MKIIKSIKWKRSIWWYLISAAITIISVAVMYRLLFKNLDTLMEIRYQIKIWPIALTFPIFFLGEILASLAWGKMMNDLTLPMPISRHQVIFIVTHAARRIPGTVWHVIGRVIWYERLGISKRVTTFVNVLETVMMVWAGLIITILLFPFVAEGQTDKLWLFLGGILLSTGLMHPRFLKFVLRHFEKSEQIEGLTFKAIITWLFFYLLLWVVGGTILFLIINALFTIPLSFWPACVAAWSLTGVAATLVLVLPSGLGLTEATLSLLLSTQIPSSIAVEAAILLRILLTIYEFFFAFVIFSLSNKVSWMKISLGRTSPEPDK